MKINPSKSLLFVLITAFCFGTMEVSLKLAGSHFDAIQLTFLRFLIGGLLLLPFAVGDLKKRRYRLTASDLLYLLILGVICLCSMTLVQFGIMYTNANLVAVVISMSPVFTMIFAHFIAGEPFTRRKAVVLLISFTGLVIVSNPSQLLAGNRIGGLLIVLSASALFGLYTAMGKRRLSKLGGMTQNSLSFLFGDTVLLIYLIASGTPVFRGITVSSLPFLFYLGFIVTGLGYFAYLKALAYGGPSYASFAFFIKPIVAIVCAFLILHEAITLPMVVGVILILSGFLLNLTKPKQDMKGSN